MATSSELYLIAPDFSWRSLAVALTLVIRRRKLSIMALKDPAKYPISSLLVIEILLSADKSPSAIRLAARATWRTGFAILEEITTATLKETKITMPAISSKMGTFLFNGAMASAPSTSSTMVQPLSLTNQTPITSLLS